jgi:uncharacterized membrane protein YfcA
MSGAIDGGLAGTLALVAASLVAGAVNAVAGGGTILTFPVLAAILPGPAPLVTANATSTIGLWPAAAVAAFVYRDNRAGVPPWTRWLIVPSAVGAAIGMLLVVCLPHEWFDWLVPWLILLAAVLFAAQPRIAALASGGPVPREAAPDGARSRLVAACGLQLLVGIYGGYFGAGIGILMLAVLAILGLGDIHRLNAVKNVLGTVINGVAAAMFALGSLLGGHEVSWPHAAVMAVAAVIGSLGGSHLARRLPAPLVRRGVAIIGFALAGYYFWRRWQT